MLHTPERLPDETQEAYKIRRKISKDVAKNVRKGWLPTNFVQHQPNKDKRNGNA